MCLSLCANFSFFSIIDLPTYYFNRIVAGTSVSIKSFTFDLNQPLRRLNGDKKLNGRTENIG